MGHRTFTRGEPAMTYLLGIDGSTTATQAVR